MSEPASQEKVPISSSVLGLDFKDRVASLPKITELFEKLEAAVCGGGSDERAGGPTGALAG